MQYVQILLLDNVLFFDVVCQYRYIYEENRNLLHHNCCIKHIRKPNKTNKINTLYLNSQPRHNVILHYFYTCRYVISNSGIAYSQ